MRATSKREFRALFDLIISRVLFGDLFLPYKGGVGVSSVAYADDQTVVRRAFQTIETRLLVVEFEKKKTFARGIPLDGRLIGAFVVVREKAPCADHRRCGPRRLESSLEFRGTRGGGYL